MASTIKALSGAKASQVRSTLAVRWRRLLVIAVSLLGLALFLGAEYGLGSLIAKGDFLYAIGIYAIVALLFVTIAYPFWGYAAWFFLSCYLALFGTALPAMFSFDLIMLGLLTFAVIFRALVNREPLTKFSTAEVFLIAFFLYACIIRREFDTSHMVAELKLLVLSPLFFYFIAKNIIREKKQIYWFMVIIIITGVTFAFMGFYEQLTGKMWLAGLMGGNRGLYGGMRSTGPAGHYYVYGNMMILTILLCLHIFRWQQRWHSKLIVIACALTCLLGLYYGFSRAPYGAFVLSIIIMLLLSRHTKRVYAAFTALAVLAAIILVPIVATDSRIQNRFREGTTKGDSRVATDRTSMSMFKAHYMFGVGRDQYQHYVPVYVSGLAHSNIKDAPNGLVTYWGKPHSEYFLILTELGIVGFFLCFATYLLFLIKFILMRSRLALDDVAGSDFAALAVAFTAGVFLTMYTDEYSLNPYMYGIIFTIYAMLAKAEHYAREEKSIQ